MINEISAFTERIIFVLDDFHLAKSEAVEVAKSLGLLFNPKLNP